MKNIIIVGPSRVGKTTLSKLLNEEFNMFVISIDKLVATFQESYPQLDIRLNWDREKTSENIAPFIANFIAMFSLNDGTVNELNLKPHFVNNNGFIIEGAYFDFEKIFSILSGYDIEKLADKFILIGLVQNKKTSEDFFADFRKYDTTEDWTYSLDNNDLKEISDDVVSFSRNMTSLLEKYDFTIYDTSVNREEVFCQIVNDVRDKF